MMRLRLKVPMAAMSVACGLLLASCSGSTPAPIPNPNPNPMPDPGRNPVIGPIQCEDPPCAASATPAAALSELRDQAANPANAVSELTNSPVHRTSNVFAAYQLGNPGVANAPETRRGFGSGKVIGIVSTSLASYAQDLRNMKRPYGSEFSLPLDADTKIAFTFASPANGLEEYGLPADFTFNHDPLFNYRLDIVEDDAIEQDNRLREKAPENFALLLRRHLQINITGPIGLILEDYRTTGSAAAAIAAGTWNDQDSPYAVMGVAPDATLYSYPVENHFSQYCRLKDCDTAEAEKFRRILHARSIALAASGQGYDKTIPGQTADRLMQTADIIYSSYIGDRSRSDFADDAAILEEYAEFRSALMAAKAADKIVVLGAGDQGQNEPSLPASLPSVDPALQSHTLAVVAVGADEEILSSSNRCGLFAADFCMAIAGEDLLSIWLNPGGSHTDETYRQPYHSTYIDNPLTEDNTDEVSGTTYAAAAAAGAITLVASHFTGPTTMSHGDVLQRIKDTANKDDAYANPSIYGGGLIDVGAAVTPVGNSALPLGTGPQGAKIGLAAATLRLQGGSFGDALANDFARRQFVYLDGLNTPFALEAGQLLQWHPSPVQSAKALSDSRLYLSSGSQLQLRSIGTEADRLALSWTHSSLKFSLGNDISPGLLSGIATRNISRPASLQEDSALFAPWASAGYRWQTATVGMRLPRGLQLRWTQISGKAEAAPDEALRREAAEQSGSVLSAAITDSIGLQWAHVQGDGEVLGLSSGESIGRVQMQAANLWGTLRLGSSKALLWSLWDTHARVSGGSGLLSRARDLRADAWTLGYADHRWMLRLEQPLRMRSGQLQLRLPVAHRADRSILLNHFSVSPAPSGREIRLQADWNVPLRRGLVQLSLGMARHPGHVGDAAVDPYAGLSLSLPLR